MVESRQRNLVETNIKQTQPTTERFMQAYISICLFRYLIPQINQVNIIYTLRVTERVNKEFVKYVVLSSLISRIADIFIRLT